MIDLKKIDFVKPMPMNIMNMTVEDFKEVHFEKVRRKSIESSENSK